VHATRKSALLVAAADKVMPELLARLAACGVAAVGVLAFGAVAEEEEEALLLEDLVAEVVLPLCGRLVVGDGVRGACGRGSGWTKRTLRRHS
jgi:hypothetical protein